MFNKSKFPDGARLLDPRGDKLWLVFGGECHHIVCNDVYTRLFKSGVSIQRIETPNAIREGDSLLFGTCLIRGQAGASAYFLAVSPSKVRLHPIYNPSVAEKYGFDYTLCRSIAWDLMKSIPKGHALI